MEVIVNGFISGVVLALLIGPVFFSIIQTSIEQGFRSGAFVAVGVSLSDAAYIALAYLGIYNIFDDDGFKEYLGYFGGIVLLMFGVYYVFIKSRKLGSVDAPAQRARQPWRLIGKGFVINGLSPMVLIFWLGAVGVATTKFGYVSPTQAVPYFASIVSTVFITDLIKAKLADKLRAMLTPKFVRSLNIVLGIVLLAFGVKMICYAGDLSLG